MQKRIYGRENNKVEETKQKRNEKQGEKEENNKGKNETISPKSKDFLLKSNGNKFNNENIDFKVLKENLDEIYYDKKLIINVVNFIRENLKLSVEVQWETNNKNKIINKISGEKGIVKPSQDLILRAKNDIKTLQVLHNHTSGIPLPHAVDILNTKNFKIINNDVVGDYGFLNMKNSFNALDFKQKAKFERINNEFYRKVKKEFIKNNPQYYGETPAVRKIPKYKYYKDYIDRIVKDYNKQFKEFGIEFNYVPYKLQKR